MERHKHIIYSWGKLEVISVWWDIHISYLNKRSLFPLLQHNLSVTTCYNRSNSMSWGKDWQSFVYFIFLIIFLVSSSHNQITEYLWLFCIWWPSDKDGLGRFWCFCGSGTRSSFKFNYSTYLDLKLCYRNLN